MTLQLWLALVSRSGLGRPKRLTCGSAISWGGASASCHKSRADARPSGPKFCPSPLRRPLAFNGFQRWCSRPFGVCLSTTPVEGASTAPSCGPQRRSSDGKANPTLGAPLPGLFHGPRTFPRGARRRCALPHHRREPGSSSFSRAAAPTEGMLRRSFRPLCVSAMGRCVVRDSGTCRRHMSARPKP